MLAESFSDNTLHGKTMHVEFGSDVKQAFCCAGDSVLVERLLREMSRELQEAA